MDVEFFSQTTDQRTVDNAQRETEIVEDDGESFLDLHQKHLRTAKYRSWLKEATMPQQNTRIESVVLNESCDPRSIHGRNKTSSRVRYDQTLLPLDLYQYLEAGFPPTVEIVLFVRNFRRAQEMYPQNVIGTEFGPVLTLPPGDFAKESQARYAVVPNLILPSIPPWRLEMEFETLELPILQKPKVQSMKATKHDDGTYTVKLVDGRTMPAVLFREVFEQNEVENTMSLPTAHTFWSPGRSHGRPEVLFMLKPNRKIQKRLDEAWEELAEIQAGNFTYEPWYGATGQVLLNSELKPLRYFSDFPMFFSTDVPGWYLESLFRTNPSVRHEDIIDRMPSTNGVVRPTVPTLRSRQARARHIMRTTSWYPLTEEEVFWERVVQDDLVDGDRANNSTRRLADLTPQRLILLEAMAWNPIPHPAKDKQRYLGRMRKILAYAKAAGYDDSHQFMVNIRSRILAWEIV